MAPMDADDQRWGGVSEGRDSDLGLQLGTDDGEFGQRGGLDAGLQRRVPFEYEAEDPRQRQQKREGREEREVGQQRDEVTCLVIAEFLKDGECERGDSVALLPRINSADGPLKRVHGKFPSLARGHPVPLVFPHW